VATAGGRGHAIADQRDGKACLGLGPAIAAAALCRDRAFELLFSRMSTNWS